MSLSPPPLDAWLACARQALGNLLLLARDTEMGGADLGELPGALLLWQERGLSFLTPASWKLSEAERDGQRASISNRFQLELSHRHAAGTLHLHQGEEGPEAVLCLLDPDLPQGLRLVAPLTEREGEWEMEGDFIPLQPDENFRLWSLAFLLYAEQRRADRLQEELERKDERNEDWRSGSIFIQPLDSGGTW